MPEDSMSLPVACALLFELGRQVSRSWAAALLQCAVTMLMTVPVLCANGPDGDLCCRTVSAAVLMLSAKPSPAESAGEYRLQHGSAVSPLDLAVSPA